MTEFDIYEGEKRVLKICSNKVVEYDAYSNHEYCPIKCKYFIWTNDTDLGESFKVYGIDFYRTNYVAHGYRLYVDETHDRGAFCMAYKKYTEP